MKMENEKLGLYRHYKNRQLYRVIGVALHTETNEQLVVYAPQYEDSEYAFFVRPYSMFFEDVEHDGEVVSRFEKVDE